MKLRISAPGRYKVPSVRHTIAVSGMLILWASFMLQAVIPQGMMIAPQSYMNGGTLFIMCPAVMDPMGGHGDSDATGPTLCPFTSADLSITASVQDGIIPSLLFLIRPIYRSGMAGQQAVFHKHARAPPAVLL